MDDLRLPAVQIRPPDQRVRVFIGNFSKELEEEQRAVEDAIRDLKLRPLVVDLDAPSLTPEEVYQACVEQSQLAICIVDAGLDQTTPSPVRAALEDLLGQVSGKLSLLYIKDAPQESNPTFKKFLQDIRSRGTVRYHTFSTSEELTELVQNDVMQLLSEAFRLETRSQRRPVPPLPDYLRSIHEEMDRNGVVKRDKPVQEVQKLLATNPFILIVGDPGSGKTYLLGELGKQLNGIYISLRNKTNQQVCAYLANHMAHQRGKAPQSLPSEDDARAALQEALADTAIVLLIDDADENPTVAQALLGMDFFDCHAIFAVSSPQQALYRNVKRVPLPLFIREEVGQFLELHHLVFPPGEVQRLYAASQGNPLYLYYFTQQQITPLPEDLAAYQQALWQKLSPLQQNALTFLAESLVPLTIAELHALLNAQQPASGTVMETKSLLTSAAPLLRQTNETYEFFHARFVEYVRSLATYDGLASHYHQLLGEHAVRQRQAVAAAYHFLHANDPRMRKHLINGAQIAILQGEILLAEQFLLQALLPVQGSAGEESTSPDIFTSYEEGMRQLLLRLDQQHPNFADALLFQQRLTENITNTRRYGDTETRRAERNEIIDHLNTLTELIAQCSFLDLCITGNPTQKPASMGSQVKNLRREAIVRYLLAQVYKELGRYQDARKQVNTSLTLFDEVHEEKWTTEVKLWSTLLLLEEGEAQKAVEALEQAVEEYGLQEDAYEAFLQINLSYAYLHISRFRKGAKAAKRATDLFKALGHTTGMYTSLINLAGHVGHLGDYTLQRTYAEQILQTAREQRLLRLQCAGLNLLAVAQRNLGDPHAAQACLEECIRISQQIGSVELETMNLINLGNALRDQNLETQAEEAYTEAMTKARQAGLPKHEGHALELLARLKFSQKLYEDALRLGTEALALQRPTGEHVRIATTQEYLARFSLKLTQNQQAAEYYEGAGEHYEAAEMWREAAYQYGQAAGIWGLLGAHEHILHCVAHQAICLLHLENEGGAEEKIKEVLDHEQSQQMSEVYLRVLELLLKQRHPIVDASFMYNFSAHCKRTSNSLKGQVFQKGLDALVAALAEKPDNKILNSLAYGIEQANEDILSTLDGEALGLRITQAIDHLYYRHHTDGRHMWTIGFDWQQPLLVQVIGSSEDPVIQYVTMALALVLRANQQDIEEAIAAYGGNQEQTFTLYVVKQQDLEQFVNKADFGPSEIGPLAAIITESLIPWDQPQPPTAIILNDEYDNIHNWAIHPGNKALVWVLMSTYAGLVAYCTHQSKETAPGLARKSREFCERVVDYGTHQDETLLSSFNIDEI